MSSHVPDWSDYVEFKKGAIAAEATRKIDEYVKRGFKRFNIPLDYGVNSSKMYRYGYFGKPRRRLRQTNTRASSRPAKRSRAMAPPSSSFVSGPRGGAKVGHAVGSSTSKKAITASNWNSIGPPDVRSTDEAIIKYELINGLDQSSGDNRINYRLRQMVNCTGIELKMFARNLWGTTSFVVNVAVVAPRNQNITIGAGFFRGYGQQRQQDFPAANSSTSLVLNDTPINSDDYNVLWRRQYTLGPQGDYNTGNVLHHDRSRSNWVNRKFWIPVNRQIRYEGLTPTSVEDPIELVYWICRVGKDSAQEAVTDAVEFKYETIMHFKEPGSL